MEILPQPTISASIADIDDCCLALTQLAHGGLSKEQSWSWTRTAIRLMRNSDSASASRIIDAFATASSGSDPELVSRFRALCANRAIHEAKYETALALALEGREVAISIGAEREIALCTSLAGAAAQRLGRFAEAANWLDDAMVSARRAGDSIQEAGALSNAALLAMLLGQPELALSRIERAITIYDQRSNPDRVARCLLNRGIFFSKLGRLAEAKLDLAAAVEHFGEASALAYLNSANLALGRVDLFQGHYGAARERIESVLKATSINSDPRKRIIALEYLGDLLSATGELPEAVQAYSQAWTAAQAVGLDTDLAIESCYRLGLALTRSGETISGFELLRGAVGQAQTSGDVFEHCAALLSYGTALQECGSGEAVDILRACIAMAIKIGDRLSHGLAALSLAKTEVPTRDAIECLALVTEAKAQFVRVGSPRWISESEDRLAEILGVIAASRQLSNVTSSRKSAIGVDQTVGASRFISLDVRVRELVNTTLRLAPRSLSILIFGETGTGKELIAEAIHVASKRSGPFVPVNCGALPGDLLEAELFGHARGAYTGADRERGGLIEFSHRGTLFLDEIGDMPLKAQARLLRALEQGEIRRLGENAPRLVDLRIVAATHRNLLEMVSTGEFRLDLYHRLAGFVVAIPPLRERKGDVELLIDHLLTNYATEQDKLVQLSPEVYAALVRHSWPGNVRQLKNVIHRLVSLAEPGQIITRLPFELEGGETPRSLPEALEAEERRRILAALEASRWNKAKAAAALGASRTTLIAKMKRLGIEPPDIGARVR
jgi:DNA-binding NtrC family response regulator/tetratricopeptide (TPR) repeat protein